jgi:DNA-binding MarR family transcriptional regulator
MDEVEVIGLLARACERLVGSVFAALDEEGFGGLTATQALAIRTLAAGPATARALAGALGVTPQAAGKVTSELEGLGLAVRGQDPRDARVRPLTLTELGRRAADAMHDAEEASIRRWREAADGGDLDATVRALRAYLAATEPPRTGHARRMRFT